MAEMEAASAVKEVERGGKERDAVVGFDELDVENMEMDAGAEVGEEIEDGEINGERERVEEEVQMEAAAGEERGGMELEAVVGYAEMEMDAGAEVEEAIEDGDVEEESEGAEAAERNGDDFKHGEYAAVDRKGTKKLKQQLRASWKGRGGRGRGAIPHRPWYGAKNQQHKLNILNRPGVYGGAIILCNPVTKCESLRKKIFALPDYATSFIRKIRAGMLLFVFEREERKLCGVFEAISDGALNILPNAFPSSRKFRPAQVRFRRVWFCKPLTEAEFSDAVEGLQPKMTFFGISYQQVLNLVDLFSSRRIGLEPYQKPISRVIWDYNISLARAGLESTLYTHSNTCPSRSSSMFCNSRISLPHNHFMYAEQNITHADYESSLRPQLKSVILKGPDRDIKEKGLEPSADYIPLDLDECKSDSDTVLSDIPGTASFYSTLLDSISYEEQAPKPFNGNRNDDDGFPSPVLNQSFISVSKTSENSAIAHFMKERQSSMLGKGSKHKPNFQFDGHTDHSSRSCTIGKKVSFCFCGDKISVTSDEELHRPALNILVTSDEELHRPALSELEQNKEAVTEERKQAVGCLVQDVQNQGGDGSAKRSKLMTLSFAEKTC